MRARPLPILAIVLVIIAALLAIAVFRAHRSGDGTAATSTTTATTIEPFSETGVLIRNNPGFKPDVWYLIYEAPSSPALTAELDLSSVAAPYVDLSVGQRVHIEGLWENGAVTIHSIAPASTTEHTNAVLLYYYNAARDQGPGGAQCSAAGLVPVERFIPKTATPLRDSIALLLRGELSDEEQAAGISTEFPLPGVTLTKATLVDGVATLTFADPQHRLSGGSCRVTILWKEVEATAKQFPTVTAVRYEPAELFQP